jgi:OOP family OmpA-OmpF porin
MPPLIDLQVFGGKKMDQITRPLLLTALGMFAIITHAATGYVNDSSGTVVRTGYGDCLHTARWSIPNAMAECDADIVAVRDKADIAAVEVVMVTEKNPVLLEADTLFDFDSAELSDAGKARLDQLLGNLTAESLMEQKLQIRGYSDRIGDDAYNLELSKRRAAAVKEYLVTNGVIPAFIETQGLGKADPVVECTGKRGAPLIECLKPNRRTEVEFSAMEVIQVEETVPVEK